MREAVVDELEGDRALFRREGRERLEQRGDERAVPGLEAALVDHDASGMTRAAPSSLAKDDVAWRAGCRSEVRGQRPREAKSCASSDRRRSAPRRISQMQTGVRDPCASGGEREAADLGEIAVGVDVDDVGHAALVEAHVDAAVVA